MPTLTLQWPVDRDGYTIEKDALPAWKEKTRAARTIIGAASLEPRVVRKGGYLQHKDVLAIDGLLFQLADTPPTEKGVLGFVSRFGLLSQTDEESLQVFYDRIAEAKRLLKLRTTGNWDALEDWMLANGKKIHLHAELQDPKTGGPPILFFRPRTLLGAMHLQFFGYITNSTQLRSCMRPGCPEWVIFGPGTSRRDTGRFCSDRCASQHRYQLKKEKKS